MKKIYLFFSLLIFAYLGFAQTLTESFDGTTFPPTDWQNIQIAGTGKWNRATTGIDPDCLPHSGAGMARYNSYNFAVGVNAILVSPPLTFTGSVAHTLDFWKYADAGWNIYADSIGIYYNSTASLTGATFLETLPRYNPVSGWYEHKYLLPASLTGTQYIIFRGYSQYGNNMFIDDINLIETPEHDASVHSIDNEIYLESTTPTIPTATIQNFSYATETNIGVTCKIYNYANEEIYTNTQNISELTAFQTSDVNFYSYTLPNAEAIYTFKIYTSITNDQNTANDTIVKTVYTYTHNKQSVLLEIGTGTWCTYCPGAAMGADDLVTNGQNVAVVENHNGDNYDYDASNARNSFYSISSYPTAIFDGKSKLVGGSHSTSLYSSYLPMYENRYAMKTAFGLSVDGTYSLNTYNISVTADRFGDTPFANSNLVVYMALTQSNITVNWQGQTHLEFVSRLMAPNANGTAVDLLNNNQVVVPLSFDFNSAWGGSIANHDYEIIVWIQDLNTKEVVNAMKMDLTEILSSDVQTNVSKSSVNVYPNPFGNQLNLSFNLNSKQDVRIEMVDIVGKTVYISNRTLNFGTQTISIDGLDLENGVYFLNITAGNEVISQKVTVSK